MLLASSNLLLKGKIFACQLVALNFLVRQGADSEVGIAGSAVEGNKEQGADSDGIAGSAIAEWIEERAESRADKKLTYYYKKK